MYKFYLDDMLLPVTPGAITEKINGKNKTVDLINDSEINLIKPPGLTDISFDFEIPAFRRPYELILAQPDIVLSKLETLMNKQRPFEFRVIRTQPTSTSDYPVYYSDKQLRRDMSKEAQDEAYSYALAAMPNNLVSPSADAAAHGMSLKQYVRTRFYLKHTLFDQSQTVTLENYQWKQDAGSQGQDFIVSISLKSYNYWGTKIINFSTDHTTGTITQTRSVESPPTRLNYTVVAGDDLARIAKIKFGDASLWANIYAENKDYIDAWHKRVGWSGSPQELFTGMILKIPPWNPNGSTY